jgi:glycine cleavage system H protein
VNTDPEGDGWFFKLTLADNHELSELMSAEQYQAYCAEQE